MDYGLNYCIWRGLDIWHLDPRIFHIEFWFGQFWAQLNFWSISGQSLVWSISDNREIGPLFRTWVFVILPNSYVLHCDMKLPATVWDKADIIDLEMFDFDDLRYEPILRTFDFVNMSPTEFCDWTPHEVSAAHCTLGSWLFVCDTLTSTFHKSGSSPIFPAGALTQVEVKSNIPRWCIYMYSFAFALIPRWA